MLYAETRISAEAPGRNTRGGLLYMFEVKGELNEIENKNINVNSGETLEFIQEKYKDVGQVYYKIGEGSWTTEIPQFNDIGEYDVYYYVKGNENYTDLGDENNPIPLKVNVDVNRESWGEKIENKTEDKQVINYVSKDGMTSAEVTGNEIIWLKEESDGTSTWYGLDNRAGVFAKGSKFWVKWLSKENDKEEYDRYFAILDESHKRQAENNKLWIFLTGVTMPDGKTEYGKLNKNVPYYIQLGDDWDEDDIQAVFIDTTEDERVEDIKFMSPDEKSDPEIESIDFPETSGSYVRLMLKHFSPYAVYDKEDESQYIESVERSIERAESNENQIDKEQTHSSDKKIDNNKEQTNNSDEKNDNNKEQTNSSKEKENIKNEKSHSDNKVEKVNDITQKEVENTEEKENSAKKESSGIKTGYENKEILLVILLISTSF